MNIDIDINDFRDRFGLLYQKISLQQRSRHAQIKEYESSKKELTTINSRLTWTEKYLGGNFGGDKEKLKRIQFLKNTLSKLRTELKKNDADLKSENDKVRVEVFDYLSKNSKKFEELVVYENINRQLLVETSSFIALLKKAKKGINDALLFTSWESLLKHPRAQNELDKFKGLLKNLQLKMDQYENKTGIKLLNGNRLEDCIQFSTEKIAMNSFKKLYDSISKISMAITNKVNEAEREKEFLFESIYQAVL